MRKQYLPWIILVFGIVATPYGAFKLFYDLNNNKGLSVYGLSLFILGVLALLLMFALYMIDFINKIKKKDEVVPPEEEIIEDEPIIKEEKVMETKDIEPKQEKKEYVERSNSTSKSSYSYSAYSTAYVKQVGYGPILRVEGNRIVDMRNNTYYRIEGDMVNQEGYGPVFEIRGNQIKNAFGGYLYELSGSSINKVYGGYFASISGNYITIYDLSQKYEMTDSLSKRQILVVVALLFGNY